MTRRQLLVLGMSPGAIRARLRVGRLHRLWPGVYAVGRPDVDRLGRLMAATLACGPGAWLSHRSAAGLWRIASKAPGRIDVSVPSGSLHRLDGIRLHRRVEFGTTRIVQGIPLADPVSVLTDLAGEMPRADLKRILDAQTFSRAQNALERRFLAIVRDAGLRAPETQRRLGRYRVDFFWPDLGLVVEAHARAGLRTLRFTHAQVFRRPDHVRAVLADTCRHLPAPGIA